MMHIFDQRTIVACLGVLLIVASVTGAVWYLMDHQPALVDLGTRGTG